MELTEDVLREAEVVVTGHAAVDYERLAVLAPLVVDTQGILRREPTGVVRA